jgi:hypothetical protein
MPYIKLTVFNGLDPILVAVFGKSEMFNFEFDVDGLIKGAEQWGAAANQMPFALSRALNDAVKDAREHLIDKTWPQHVTMRNSQFIGWALRIDFSDKYNLEARIYDQSKGNVHLKLHDQGGVKTTQGRFAMRKSLPRFIEKGLEYSVTHDTVQEEIAEQEPQQPVSNEPALHSAYVNENSPERARMREMAANRARTGFIGDTSGWLRRD